MFRVGLPWGQGGQLVLAAPYLLPLSLPLMAYPCSQPLQLYHNAEVNNKNNINFIIPVSFPVSIPCVMGMRLTQRLSGSSSKRATVGLWETELKTKNQWNSER